MSAKKPASALRFFILLYALSAPWWIAQLFIGTSGLPLDIPITDIGAAFMPLVAACILVRHENGPGSLKPFLRRIVDYRRTKNLRWFGIAALLPLMLFVIIFAAMAILGLPLVSTWQVSLYALPLLLAFFILGAIGEEVGYMGYAFDPLRNKFGAIASALIIGLPWAVWHYPSILEQGHTWSWIFWGTIGTIAIRVLLVWIYEGANNSLSAVILFHAIYNTGRVLFPQNATIRPLVDHPEIHYTVFCIAALVIAFLWMRSRKPKSTATSTLPTVS